MMQGINRIILKENNGYLWTQPVNKEIIRARTKAKLSHIIWKAFFIMYRGFNDSREVAILQTGKSHQPD
jgi:hypothetical protein